MDINGRPAKTRPAKTRPASAWFGAGCGSRATRLLVTSSLSLGISITAVAQPSQPGAAPGADLAGQPDTNPPAIAGRLAAMAGTVSFHAAGETQWSPATLNYPVTNGEAFWTEPQASATIGIADDRVVLDESTEFDITTLDQSQFVATAAQGAVFIQLNSVIQGQTLVINTPRGSVQISQAGEYEIVAGDTNDPTTISVVAGAAHIGGTNLSLDAGPNQTVTITGSDTLQGSVGPLQQDAFLGTQLRLASEQRPASDVPAECRVMTGGMDLASSGRFTQSAQYGQVWYPNAVPAGWAPYRDGHWAYVAPWGWNWVDNARWGFAPFHYGRWAQIEGRWGWLPGGGAPYVAGTYPVYAPALVAFIGVGSAGLGFSAGAFAGGYAPAWIPLGPREPFYPWYHVRDGYFARINSFYGVPRGIIDRGPDYYNSVNFHQTNIFINRSAATVIPATAFARGQSALVAGRPLPERAFADARPLAGRLPVTPTALTPNLPPAAARRFNVPVATPPLHPAAGPRITPAAAGVHDMPPLRRAALPQNVHATTTAARPGLAAHGLPPLRAPGARPQALPHPVAADTHVAPAARPEAPKAQPGRPHAATPHADVTRPAPSRPASHEAARPEISRPAAHEAAPHRARAETPRVEAPKAAVHAQPRPAVHEAPHAEPHHAEAPHPASRPAAHPDAKHEPHR